jgi:hypothetical protein
LFFFITESVSETVASSSETVTNKQIAVIACTDHTATQPARPCSEFSSPEGFPYEIRDLFFDQEYGSDEYFHRFYELYNQKETSEMKEFVTSLDMVGSYFFLVTQSWWTDFFVKPDEAAVDAKAFFYQPWCGYKMYYLFSIEGEEGNRYGAFTPSKLEEAFKSDHQRHYFYDSYNNIEWMLDFKAFGGADLYHIFKLACAELFHVNRQRVLDWSADYSMREQRNLERLAHPVQSPDY